MGLFGFSLLLKLIILAVEILIPNPSSHLVFLDLLWPITDLMDLEHLQYS